MKSIDAARDERKCKVNEVFMCRVEWELDELGVVTRRENAFTPRFVYSHSNGDLSSRLKVKFDLGKFQRRYKLLNNK